MYLSFARLDLSVNKFYAEVIFDGGECGRQESVAGIAAFARQCVYVLRESAP